MRSRWQPLVSMPDRSHDELIVQILDHGQNGPASIETDFSKLIERFKQVVGERVTGVRASNRLSQSVARLADADSALNPELQRVYRYLGKEYEVPKKVLELSPSHPILKKMLEMDSASELQTLIIEAALNGGKT